jgi:hypothetical protein
MKPKTPTPHDALFEAAFQNPDHAAATFRAVLPPELVRPIDWSSLRLESGSFVDAELRETEGDLAFSVEAGWDAVVFALVFDRRPTLEEVGETALRFQGGPSSRFICRIGSTFRSVRSLRLGATRAGLSGLAD